MAPLVWLVTGTTSGIGRALIEHIVSRGDKVIASGRKIEERLGSLKSESLALLELDMTAGPAAMADKVKEAWSIFGHIDILLNNAGMSAMRTAEESDESYISKMFTVNLFGPMQLTQALLPYLRAARSGAAAAPARIGFTSSSTAWTPLPFMAHYAASKAALSAYVEALHKEVAPLGIDCVAFECGGFPTHLGQPRAEGETAFASESSGGIAAYAPGMAALGGMFMADPMAFMPGDLGKVAVGMVDVLKREGVAAGRPWAVRVLFGSDAFDSVRQKCDEMLRLTGEWKDVSYGTDRDGYAHVTRREYLEFVSILEGGK
ncbi:hypothetical protein B0T22DRAFT_427941 [Podospora appendiculata]|uniref:Dehydrogenase n=1 Tax=Podospora appendiculata TaxID=314037 RepID=A0AAE0XBT6_9PEZI|nr:hypothetical protein B0T22DRAFT_427941 [Podospora appendiculata]